MAARKKLTAPVPSCRCGHTANQHKGDHAGACLSFGCLCLAYHPAPQPIRVKEEGPGGRKKISTLPEATATALPPCSPRAALEATAAAALPAPPQTTAAAPQTTRTSEGAAPPARRVSIRWANGAFAILSIANGGAPADYLAERIMPRVHRLTKLEPGRQTSYTVFLANPLDKGQTSSCSCEGNRKHGHCKHVEAIVALRESGRLD
jgi:hypothetical protein